MNNRRINKLLIKKGRSEFIQRINEYIWTIKDAISYFLFQNFFETILVKMNLTESNSE